MSNVQWVLKRIRYDGSDTVISRYSVKADADDDADLMNNAYQSKQYYVEELDPKKLDQFSEPRLMECAKSP